MLCFRRPIIFVSGTLAMALVLLFAPAYPGKAGSQDPLPVLQRSAKTPMVDEPFGWQLQDAGVVSRGKTVQTSQGVLTTGYTVEAFAVAEGRAPVARGLFRATITAFSPTRDMPGQKAGRWYVRGDWSITNEEAAPEIKKMRYSPAVVKGTLVAELSFNPATDEGAVDAGLRVPRLANARGNGRGAFQGNQNFEGRIDMVLKR